MSSLAATVVTMQRAYPTDGAEPEAVLVISDGASEVRMEIEQFFELVDSVYQTIGVFEPEPEPEPQIEPAAPRSPSRLVVKQSRVDDEI